MNIEVLVNIYSGIDWFIEYEYWIDDYYWKDPKGFNVLWKKKSMDKWSKMDTRGNDL